MRRLKRVMALASLGIGLSLPFGSNSLENILFTPAYAAENAGDGSNEPGFVPAPVGKETPAPPANMAGGESFIPYPPPPAAPQARSEKKNPPGAPKMFTQIVGGPDSNARPNALNNLLKVLKKEAEVDYACEFKSWEEISADPAMNPILYFSKYNRWSLNTKERDTLREFLIRGGTLILNAGGGSWPAYDSAVKEASLILPQASVQRLSPDNPIFHSYYELDKVKASLGKDGTKIIEPRVSGLTIDCRVAIIIPEFGMDSCSDEFREGIDKVLFPEDAQKLGMNILSYASANRAYLENLKREVVLRDKVVNVSGNLSLVQVMYNGEWKTKDAGLPMLLNEFNRTSGVPVKFNYDTMKLTDPKIFDSPVLFITGHEQFSFKPEERKKLSEYLQGGGMLIAEACCGRKGFDVSFRREINNLIPGETLRAVSPGDALYHMPNKLGQMSVTPALANAMKSPTMNPQLFTLNHNGKNVVLYSPIGEQAGWEVSSSPYSMSYAPSDALKLGVNQLLYSMTR
ncbi:MAG: DUF4159 domain-containing protein [archaeon]